MHMIAGFGSFNLSLEIEPETPLSKHNRHIAHRKLFVISF